MMKSQGAAAASIAAAALAAAGIAAASLPAIPASAAVFGAARMAIPPELEAASERIELRGLGGATRGRFRLGGAEGRFTRSATRLGIADPLFVRHRGGGSFETGGSATIPALAGRCRYSERQVNAGPVSVMPQRLGYRCAFRRGDQALDAELVLVDPAGPLGRLDGRAVREGVLRYHGREIAIRSVHRFRGGRLPAPTALGYLFLEGGRAIGAVDINGSKKTIFAPLGAAEREAVIAASLALSIFWDPAVVQPDG